MRVPATGAVSPWVDRSRGADAGRTAIEIDDEVREVVGILGDVRTREVTAAQRTVFVPLEQVPDDHLSFANRCRPSTRRADCRR